MTMKRLGLILALTMVLASAPALAHGWGGHGGGGGHGFGGGHFSGGNGFAGRSVAHGFGWRGIHRGQTRDRRAVPLPRKSSRPAARPRRPF